MLSSLGEAYPAQLARAVGLPQHKLGWVMEGREPYYSTRFSVVGQGLARVVESSSGRVYQITTRGRRKARSLTRRARSGSEAF